MVSTVNVEFKSVVRQMYEIAESFYDNDLQNHMLQVYNRLNDEQQKTFLTGAIPLIFDIEKPPKKIREQVELDYDEFNVENFNAIEMIKLKSWIVKCGMVFTVGVFFLIISYVLGSALMPGDDTGHFTQLFDFLKVIFVN